MNPGGLASFGLRVSSDCDDATSIGTWQCLSQDFDFFPKKELFNLFRELLAKERSYPFTVKIAR